MVWVDLRLEDISLSSESCLNFKAMNQMCNFFIDLSKNLITLIELQQTGVTANEKKLLFQTILFLSRGYRYNR